MSASIPPLRLGFVGGYGHHYLAGALTDPTLTVEAVAVASDGRDPDAARRRVEQLPGAQWFDDYEIMLDRFQPNVVSVGAVYAHNGPLLRAILERGALAVSDKPVAATWDDYHALVEASRHRRFITDFNFPCWAAFRAMRQAVRDGRIGTVVLVNAQKSYRFGDARPDFYRRRGDYASTLLWVASHMVDIVPFVTGQGYTRVAAQHGNVARRDYGSLEDFAIATFTLTGGGAAVIYSDYHQPKASKQHGDDRLRIVGDRGIAEVRDHRCVLVTHDHPETDITDEADERLVHRAHLDALFHGDTDCSSVERSLRTAAALLHARDAADSGNAVTIG